MAKHAFILTSIIALVNCLLCAVPTYAQSCASISSIQLVGANGNKTSSVSLGELFQCKVTVNNNAQTNNLACGVVLNGQTHNWCPSTPEYFGGWNGNTATFNCVITDKDLSNILSEKPQELKLELKAHNFGVESCDKDILTLPFTLQTKLYQQAEDINKKSNKAALYDLLNSLFPVFNSSNKNKKIKNEDISQNDVKVDYKAPKQLEKVFKKNNLLTAGQNITKYVANKYGKCIPHELIWSIWIQETSGPSFYGNVKTMKQVCKPGVIKPCVINSIGACGPMQFMPYTWPGYQKTIANYEGGPWKETKHQHCCNLLAAMYAATDKLYKDRGGGENCRWSAEQVRNSARRYYGACSDAAADYCNDIIKRICASGYKLAGGGCP